MSQVASIAKTHSLSATVGDNIRAEAARRRITQGELAQRLGMSRAAVSARFTGVTPWSIDEMEQAARLFGVRPADLCAARDSNPEPSDYEADVIPLNAASRTAA